MFLKNSFPGNNGGMEKSSSPIKERGPSATHLIVDILNGGSTLRVKITGKSMVPFLYGGEIALIKKVPCSHMHRGDLILFKSFRNALTLHRIIHKKGSNGETIFLTKGDAMRAFDEGVQYQNVLGKVYKLEIADSNGVRRVINMGKKRQRIINNLIIIFGLAKIGMIYFLTELRKHRPPLSRFLYNRPLNNSCLTSISNKKG